MRLDLSNTSLEVSPAGGGVDFKIEQLGNSPSKPYYTKLVKGGMFLFRQKGLKFH